MRTKADKRPHHEGKLDESDKLLFKFIEARGKLYTSSLEIQKLTGCVSARDRIRKLRANNLPVSNPAKYLYTTNNGKRVSGWRVEKNHKQRRTK